MLIAETRPSSEGGVTLWRSVAVAITQTIGPAPMKKKLRAASGADGVQIVATMNSAATNPATGPSAITRPNDSDRMIRGAPSAPPIMPTPYVASVTPTADADSPRCSTAYGTYTAWSVKKAALNTNCVMKIGRSNGWPNTKPAPSRISRTTSRSTARAHTGSRRPESRNTAHIDSAVATPNASEPPVQPTRAPATAGPPANAI